jgi:hypothetical protein
LRSPAAFIASTFFCRWSSTNGPFFRLRGMDYLRAPRPRRRRMISSSDFLPFLRVRPSGFPHGGGEGSTTAGRHPVTPWGVPTLGYRTRKQNKTSDRHIVRGRRRGKGKHR